MVLVTGLDGRARWEFPELYETAPVVTATCVAAEPVVAVLEAVTDTYVVVRAWAVSSGRAKAGAAVHVTVATPS